jgi:hypothetical protein
LSCRPAGPPARHGVTLRQDPPWGTTGCRRSRLVVSWSRSGHAASAMRRGGWTSAALHRPPVMPHGLLPPCAQHHGARSSTMARSPVLVLPAAPWPRLECCPPLPPYLPRACRPCGPCCRPCARRGYCLLHPTTPEQARHVTSASRDKCLQSSTRPDSRALDPATALSGSRPSRVASLSESRPSPSQVPLRVTSLSESSPSPSHVPLRVACAMR